LSPREDRALILCADDFGLSDAISATIAELAWMKRLSAISCMSVLEAWPRHARRLKGLGRDVAVGLHLVLTDEQPLGFAPTLAPAGRMPGADPLTALTLSGRAPLVEIGEEINRQFDAFEAERGGPPDFVDGHQHVHMLPGVRAIVIDVVRRRAPGAWIRDCSDTAAAIASRPFPVKAARSGVLCAGLRHAAERAGIRTNLSFAGYYDFRADYQALFPSFLRHASAAHLVMCHPGAGRACDDRIAEARIREAELLRSRAFEEMLERAELSLSPYRHSARQPVLRLLQTA
jgi:predicted glycoside hydrolase/deacetylase ChbG (UPF0249 family)